MFSATSSAVGLRSATIAQAIQRITNPSCLLASQRECSIPSDTPEEVFAPYRELVEVVTRIARALIFLDLSRPHRCSKLDSQGIEGRHALTSTKVIERARMAPMCHYELRAALLSCRHGHKLICTGEPHVSYNEGAAVGVVAKSSRGHNSKTKNID
jgi:hypothetical protein